MLGIHSTPIFEWIDFDYSVVNQKDRKYNNNNNDIYKIMLTWLKLIFKNSFKVPTAILFDFIFAIITVYSIP